MIKNKTVIEFKIGENSYELQCGPQSPLGEVHDVLCMMKAFVVAKMKDQQEAEDKLKEKAAEPVVE